jgi:UDP-N-acetyl-D-mannosaminuronic acid dehydrogenase
VGHHGSGERQHGGDIVVIVGTPVDEHLNRDLAAVPQAIERCADYLRNGS